MTVARQHQMALGTQSGALELHDPRAPSAAGASGGAAVPVLSTMVHTGAVADIDSKGFLIATCGYLHRSGNYQAYKPDAVLDAYQAAHC